MVERRQALIALEQQLELYRWHGTPAGDDAVYAYGQVWRGGADWLREYLSWSATAYLDPKIARMLWGALDSFPAQTKLRAVDVPFPSGFIWLGEAPELGALPFDVPEDDEFRETYNAWRAKYGDTRITAIGWEPTATGSIGIVAYCSGYVSRWSGKLNPIFYTDVWSWGETIAQAGDKANLDAYLEAYATAQENPGLYHQTQLILTAHGQVIRRVAYSLFAFMRQRIAALEPVRPDRALRRRVEAAKLPERTVQIITLRAKETARYEAVEAAEGNVLTCQFVVRGHWHRFWKGSGENRELVPQWLDPYIKGPEGAPFKGGLKVFDVSR